MRAIEEGFMTRKKTQVLSVRTKDLRPGDRVIGGSVVGKVYETGHRDRRAILWTHDDHVTVANEDYEWAHVEREVETPDQVTLAGLFGGQMELKVGVVAGVSINLRNTPVRETISLDPNELRAALDEMGL